MSSHGDNLDRLSSLPEELITHILSLMPTNFSVRTCILSKSWRYSWTFVHNFDLDCDYFCHGRHFSKFCDQVLELSNPFQVRKIRIDLYKIYIPMSSLSKWISKAVTFDLCELDMKVTHAELPPSIFTCKTLTKFRLHYCDPEFSLPDCVSSVNLPNLITLDINVANTPFYDAFKLIHGCPKLVNLSLIIRDWDGNEDFTFNIPTLKRLKLSIFRYSRMVHKVIINMPNLECLIVDGFWCLLFVIEDLSSLLSLTTKCWISSVDHCQWPKFSNLKRLELQGREKAGRSWQLIPQFLERCSMLEFFGVDKPNAGVWVEPLSIPACMLMKLKTMRYSKAKGDMNDIQFLSFILLKSKALKMLTVECDAMLSSKEEKELLAELSTFDRDFRDCQIHFARSLCQYEPSISVFEKRSSSASNGS